MTIWFEGALVVLVALAATGSWLDWHFRRLPNWLCLLTAACGIAWSVIATHTEATFFYVPPAWYWSAAHGVLALLVGMVLFALRWIGGGDAKFYAALACWFPLGRGIVLLGSVGLGGLLVVLVWFVSRRVAGKKLVARADDKTGKLPFGIAIAAGAVLAFLA